MKMPVYIYIYIFNDFHNEQAGDGGGQHRQPQLTCKWLKNTLYDRAN